MGFPRVLSKNNKIYTKLGEFCLSGDASFWILCNICQQELQSQDHFFKHIQDEHNFMHGIAIKTEHNRNTGFIEAEAPNAPPLLPLPLYRKVNEEEQRASEEHEENSQEQMEPKDYTEMRAIEPSAVEIDIKVEPHSLSLPPPPPQTTQQQHQHQQQTQASQVQISASTPTIYQLPQVPPVSAYATIVQSTPSLPPLHMAVGPPPLTAAATLLGQHELPKESNSTTASASSAVSSDDGERWYICDYETCGLKFKYQSRLELHRSVHSKERRFACELCGASFKQSCNLSTHRKKKHFLKGSKLLLQQRF